MQSLIDIVCSWRDNSTGNDLYEAPANADGTRGPDTGIPPVVFKTTQRAWFLKATVNETVWTDVYKFASGGGVFGITAARRYIDPATKREVCVMCVRARARFLLTMPRPFSLCSPWTWTYPTWRQR